MKDKFEKIKGRMLHKITDNSDNLQLHLDNKEIIEFYAEGDCCSDSWIEHIESPPKPEKIISMEEIEIPPSYDCDESNTKKRNPDHMDSVQFYFYRINTENGSYLIEMRNNSNGYYGGYLC